MANPKYFKRFVRANEPSVVNNSVEPLSYNKGDSVVKDDTVGTTSISLYETLPEPSETHQSADEVMIVEHLIEPDVVFLEEIKTGEGEIDKNAVFRAAEENNVDLLNKALKQGLYVDSKDEFGWTPLMSAVCAKATEGVEILLNAGANPKHKDSTGMSVLDLARQKGQSHLIRFDAEDNPCVVTEYEYVGTSFFCEECQSEIKDASRREHSSSLIHLFNLGPAKTAPSYVLPESNIGYQIMLKSGWNPNVGLGSSGQGRKNPAKTVLKVNRTGLGAENLEAKVTHFKPYDVSAIKQQEKQAIQKYKTSSGSKGHDSAERSKTAELRRTLFY